MKDINIIKRLSKGKKALILALTAGFAATACAGVATLSNNSASAMDDTTRYQYTIDGDLWDKDAKVWNAPQVKELVKQITGKPNGTLKDLEEAISQSSTNDIKGKQIYANNGDRDIVFSMYDGLTDSMTVCYVSKLPTGEIIATIMDSANGGAIPYSAGWYSNDSSFTYPSNLYSTSYVRSFLNGTPYATVEGASAVVGGTVTNIAVTDNSQVYLNYEGAQHSMWAAFLDGKEQYFVQPKFVPWQNDGLTLENLTEIDSDWAGWPAEAENWMLKNNGPYADKGGLGVYYDSWGNDYLWLPSIAEMGYGASGNVEFEGLWGVTVNQRKNITMSTAGVISGAWLRGAVVTNNNTASAYAYYLQSDALGTNGPVTSRIPYKVAFHLNLTKVLSTLGDNGEDDYQDLQDEWNSTIERSLMTGRQQTFTLTRNWIAALSDNTKVGTTFGKGIGFFEDGALKVPQGANVKLDLNGYTLDRNLGKAVEHGAVIYNYSDLEICDSSAGKTGKISGGYTASYDGGGIFTAGGTLTINGGTICNNVSQSGGGVSAYWNGTRIIMNDGAISNNRSYSTLTGGGGIYMVDKGYVEINGGEISDNVSLRAGAGIKMATEGSRLTINGGKISRNIATDTTSNADGAGIHGFTDVYIYGGEISGNYITGRGYGGGLCTNGPIYMYGGEISDNYCPLNGGGIYANVGTFNMYGGSINNNLAGRGGGMYFTYTTFNMYGGEIDGNRASLYGAGLYLYTSAVFNLNNGTLSNNVSQLNSGAVCISGGSGNGGVMTMNGGRIINNRVIDSLNAGSAVTINTKTSFTINGGLITGNEGVNAVDVSETGTFTFNGGQIKGNTNSARDDAANWPSDVCLNGTAKIRVTRKLPDNAVCGFYFYGGKPAVATTGYSTSGNAAADYRKHFFACTTKEMDVALVSGEINYVTASRPAKTDVQWRIASNGGTPVNRPVSELYYSAVYNPDAFYTVDRVNMTEGILSILDESGRQVSNPISAAGVYTFTVKNAENYNNPIYTFEITPRNFADARIEIIEKGIVYDGLAKTPQVRVTLQGLELVEGTDYTVAYSDNINAGQGIVTVTGKGNYANSKSSKFEIAKRSLQIKWGDNVAVYDGTDKGLELFAEGLLFGETAEIGIVYEDRNGGADAGRLVTPVNAGTYRAYAVIFSDNYQFAVTATTFRDFVINPKNVSAVWSGNSFVYNGQAQAPTAYYTDIEGNKVQFVVTVTGDHADAATYTAVAAAADGNYAPTVDTASLTYKIAPAKVNVTNANGSAVYTGEEYAPDFTITNAAFAAQDLPTADDLTLTYYRGTERLTDAPVAVGKYSVEITVNGTNFTTDGLKLDFEITPAPMTLAGDVPASGTSIIRTYNGLAQSTVFTATGVKGEDLALTVEYSSNSGATYGAEAPVNAGDYLVRVTENDGNYATVVYTFTVNKRTVTVNWTADDYSVKSGSDFVWAYDGKEHAPLYAVTDEVEIDVTGARNTGTFTVTATFKNAADGNNYQLAGATANCRIENSRITEIVWYGYGSSVPVSGAYEIEEIYVYGANGPRLTAYGKVQQTGAAKASLIALDVEYTQKDGNSVQHNGLMWAQGEYIATASLTGHGSLCELPSGVTADMLFKVVAQKFDTDTVEGIVWAVETDGGYVLADGYTFIYNGRPQGPVALMPSTAEGTVNLADASTYTVLSTGGRYVDAGSYVAFIRPGNYNIDPDDASFNYTISPREIEISWSGDSLSDGFVWTYDGEEHAPTATVRNVAGIVGEIAVTVEKEVNAGTYTAVAVVNKNFTIAESDTSSAKQQYKIKKRVINPGAVIWTADEDAEERDGYFVWTQDGKVRVPEATLTLNGEVIKIIVSGATSEAGTHYATAILDESDFANANYSLAGATKRFDIVRNTISQVIWENTEFTYDKNEHKPTAYYLNAEGVRVDLEVFGARTDAGRYVAYVTSDAHIINGATCEFTIAPKPLNVVWTNGSFTYNGNMQKPTATVIDSDDNTSVHVTLQEGVDYVVTGYRNAGSHVALLTFINNNYTYVDGTETCGFTIAQKSVTVYWEGVDGGWAWQYDGKSHAPSVTAEQSNIIAGETLEIAVLGAETRVGNYTAYAVTDDGNYYLVNNGGGEASRTYSIKPWSITLEWHGNADKDGAFEWDYTGDKAFAPTATYTNWETDDDGEYIVHELTVENGGIMGAQVDASLTAYYATALLPENCAFANSNVKEFKINKWTIKQVDWSADELAEAVYGDDGETVIGYKWIYDGELHGPKAEVHATGAGLVVTGETRGAGKYVAVAKLSNPENYAFSDDTAALEMPFEIVAREVEIEWFGVDDVNEEDENASFDWAYTGSPICPVPRFKGVDGEYITAPVSGAAVNASESDYYALAIDVFNDYDFNILTTMKSFSIHKKAITVSWSGEVEPEGDVFTYEFNGRAQQPFADADIAGVNFAYTVTDQSGAAVQTVISVGTYTITATPTDGNYVASGTMSVTVVIEPKPVAVVWGETTLNYTGEDIAPKAWYIDASGLAVQLVVTVEGDHSVAGTYTATPSLASGTTNYVLSSSAAQPYTIVKHTVDGIEWDFENNCWKNIPATVPPATPDPDEGGDAETTE